MKQWTDLPEDILDQILHFLLASPAPGLTLFRLARVNKALAEKLARPSSKYLWNKAWFSTRHSVADVEAEYAGARRAQLTARDLLHLAGFSGCMLCDKSEALHISRPPKIRCCFDCLLKNLVAELCLKRQFLMQPKLYQQLPYLKATMYKPQADAFSIRVYWTPHVQQVLQQEHGKPACQHMPSHQELQLTLGVSYLI